MVFSTMVVVIKRIDITVLDFFIPDCEVLEVLLICLGVFLKCPSDVGVWKCSLSSSTVTFPLDDATFAGAAVMIFVSS